MPRAIWKGAITFGLVHVPVGLYPASQESDIDFDWLDETHERARRLQAGQQADRPERSTKEHIVKGIKSNRNGKYVLLSDEEITGRVPEEHEDDRDRGLRRRRARSAVRLL